jgi:hypothetical protein
LCERAIAKLYELSRGQQIELQICDIAKDPELFQRLYLSIPVVDLDGKTVFQAGDIRTPADIEHKLETIILSLKD